MISCLDRFRSPVQCKRPVKSDFMQNLPLELLHMIFERLNYATRTALGLTCRGLYAKISAWLIAISSSKQHAKLRDFTIIDLLEIEQWPFYSTARTQPPELKQPLDRRDFFACSICLRIRSAGKFSNAMMKGKRGKLGSGSFDDKRTRFCILCGVTTARYQRGVYMQFGGALGGFGKVCRNCGHFAVLRVYHNSEMNACTCGT